jgi:hypothetical protein
MRERLIQCLTVLLCVSLGAAQACLCRPSADADSEAATAAAAATAATATAAAVHACCPSESTPARRDGCHECAANDLMITTRTDASIATDFSPFFASQTENHAGALATAHRAYRVAGDIPIPPLLRDLHHLSTQLTE